MSAPTKSTFLWNNLMTTGMASCDNTNPTYPCTNLIDEDASSVTRTNDESGTTTWLIDLGTSIAFYDTVGIANHNFSSSGTFQIGRDADNSGWSMTTITMTANHYIYYWDDLATTRYIKFTSNETTGDGYHEIGEIYVGKRYECTYNPQIPMKIIRRSNETHHQTGGSQIWSYVNYTQCGYELKFIDDVTPAMYASVEEIFDDRGFGKPFFFNLAPNDSNDKVFFSHFEKFDFSIDGKDKRPGTIIIAEEK